MIWCNNPTNILFGPNDNRVASAHVVHQGRRGTLVVRPLTVQVELTVDPTNLARDLSSAQETALSKPAHAGACAGASLRAGTLLVHACCTH